MNRREAIHLDDQDRVDWLTVLGEVCSRCNWRCHGYCEMAESRACTARNVRQPHRCVLTAHPVPTSVPSRANLDAQGGFDFLSVSVIRRLFAIYPNELARVGEIGALPESVTSI